MVQFPESNLINNNSVLRVLTYRMYRNIIANNISYEAAQNHVFSPLTPVNIVREMMPVFPTSPWARNVIIKIKRTNPSCVKTGRCRYCPRARAQTRCWRVLSDKKPAPPLHLVSESGTRQDHRWPSRKPVGIADTRVAGKAVKDGRRIIRPLRRVSRPVPSLVLRPLGILRRCKQS